MTKLSKCFASIAVVLAITPVAAAEGSFTVNFGALAVGKTVTLNPGHLFWAGAFSGALFDADNGPMNHAFVTCPSTNDLDLKAGKDTIAGYCVISDGAYSTIIAKFTCEGMPGTCTAGLATWSEGTGKWKGMTASVNFSGQLGKALEDGSVPTYATWHVDYQMP